MKVMKKRATIILAIVICISLLIGVFFMVNILPDNVFEEMYQSIKSPSLTKTDFAYMNGVDDGLSSDPHAESYDFFQGVYDSLKLADKERITIAVGIGEKPFVAFDVFLEIEDTQNLHYRYIYNLKTNILEIEPISILTHNYEELGVEIGRESKEAVTAFLKEYSISHADLEKYRDHYLQKFLNDWVEGNGEYSKFKVGDYGKYNVEDNLFKTIGRD